MSWQELRCAQRSLDFPSDRALIIRWVLSNKPVYVGKEKLLAAFNHDRLQEVKKCWQAESYCINLEWLSLHFWGCIYTLHPELSSWYNFFPSHDNLKHLHGENHIIDAFIPSHLFIQIGKCKKIFLLVCLKDVNILLMLHYPDLNTVMLWCILFTHTVSCHWNDPETSLVSFCWVQWV